MSGLGEGGLSLEGVDLDEDWDPEKYEVRTCLTGQRSIRILRNWDHFLTERPCTMFHGD